MKTPWEYYFNNISALIVLVSFIQLLAFFTFPFALFKIIFNIDKIQSGDNEFNSKYGSLFMEFKNDKGMAGSIYYFIYFTRRIGFILSQLFLNSIPSLQFGLNAGMTLTILGYLIIYRPFKVTTVGISNLVSEAGILLVLVTSFTFNFELSNDSIKFLENFLISSVLFCMTCQITISLVETIMCLKRKILDYKNNNKYSVQSEIYN